MLGTMPTRIGTARPPTRAPKKMAKVAVAAPV
jgi:hypothetical protein